MKTVLHYDAVVIGAGTAGLTAAARLAQAGATVCLIAKGQGSTHLAPATIDVAGYAPGLLPAPVPAAAPEGVESTAAASETHAPAKAQASGAAGLKALCASHPEHPYNKLGIESVAAAAQWLQETVAAHGPGGYGYVGTLERNVMLPTAVGSLRPSALVPTTMIAGDAATLSRVAIVGATQLRDFHPNVCAQNLKRAGIDARAFTVPLMLGAQDNRADIGPLHLARAVEDSAWRERFCLQLQDLIGDAEQVGLPAVLGLTDPGAVHADLQDKLGRAVFEIPTLPPSVPGVRMYEALRSALRAARGRLVLGPEIIGATRTPDGGVASVIAHGAGHNTTYAAEHFVLATGGFASGGIDLDSRWQSSERIFGLPLAGLPAPDEPRFGESYFGEQPMARVGVATGPDLRAGGAPNVLVVGAALSGAAPWREGSGEGIALASGYQAAELITGALQNQTLASR